MKTMHRVFWCGAVLGIGTTVYFAAENARKDGPDHPVPQIKTETSAVSRDTRFTTSFSPIVKKVAASVVNIYSTKTVRETLPDHPFYGSPLFRQFFDDEEGQPRNREPRSRQEQGLGSGVIISPDGYVLTASHVVEGADEVKLSIDNNQKTFTARIVGTDPQTDIAVLRVEDEQLKLPAITVADSDKLEVGDVVLAIGNPFGVGQTVTMGIVSGVGRRSFGIVDYEDFIQTDASINPGNSGGALVDAEGRLVGINTAILSRTGGNQGVGFAVPINMARMIMERIIKEGKVVRGYLGVNIQPLTPELAEQFELPEHTGALVSGVRPNSPAAEAGLEAGDVIVEFNGRKVTDSRHLRLLVAQTLPNTKINLKVLRDGKTRTFAATLDELTAAEGIPAPLSRRGAPPAKRQPGVLEGIELTDLAARTRRQWEIPANVTGALVANVAPGSAAQRLGLRPGDVIMEINRQPVTSADEVLDRSQNVRGKSLLLRVWSEGGSQYLLLPVPPARRN